MQAQISNYIIHIVVIFLIYLSFFKAQGLVSLHEKKGQIFRSYIGQYVQVLNNFKVVLQPKIFSTLP